ncbi:MAG: hypothetical protein D6723_09680 [Acidobacteria bacterium]|nr:MAG: hypothetical protein D6723_09680 [Acidobacteriota bacterium]
MSGSEFIRRLREGLSSQVERIVHHPFVEDVRRGRLPRETLKVFTEQEYHYVAHIYDYFALSVLRSPDREMKEFFIGMAQREVEYIRSFLRFARALGLERTDLDASRPLAGAMAAPNYLFHLAASGSPEENMTAFFVIEDVWMSVCRTLHDGLKQHYGFPDDVLEAYHIPAIDFQVEERLIDRHTRTAEARSRAEMAARLALEYEARFFDAVYRCEEM